MGLPTISARDASDAKPAFDLQERNRLRKSLGERLKALRTERKFTLEKLAARSSLAVSTIYKIETGRVSPSYENLVRIARGLDVNIERLFESRSENGDQPLTARMTVTRAGEGEKISGSNYRYEMLCNALSKKKIIPLVATIGALETVTNDQLSAHDGEETVYVLHGEVELHLEHYAPVILNEGDCAYFDSTMKHALRALGAGGAKIFWACTHVTTPSRAK